MSVKGIFKTLIGTIMFIVLSFIIIEIFNVSITSMQLNHITKISAKQACILLSQETYKQKDDGTGGSSAVHPITDLNGSIYVSGNLYNGNTPDEIYTNMYTSSEFKQWMETDAVQKGNWKSLQILNAALNVPGSTDVEAPTYNPEMSDESYDREMDKFSDSQMAKTYKEVMITPLNMGVPYLDKDTLQNIFRWNTAALMALGDKESIKQDSHGQRYVSFSGFRVYADEANIIDLEYRVYDLTMPSDRLAFRNITGIDPDNLGFEFNAEYLGTATDERQRVCLVGVRYSVPMAYEGITPIRKAFDFTMGYSVKGLDANIEATNETWNDSKADLASGGFDGTDGLSNVLPVPGKLIYYIIR